MPGGKRSVLFEREEALPFGREYTPSGARLNGGGARLPFGHNPMKHHVQHILRLRFE
jgi:hypothetical protein